VACQAELTSAQTSTGTSVTRMEVEGEIASLVISGRSPTGSIEWRVEQSLDGGTNWAVVLAGVRSPAQFSTTLGGAFTIPYPVGQYRINLTTCAGGCSFTATAKCGPLVQRGQH
jgi:hypothetical protein